MDLHYSLVKGTTQSLSALDRLLIEVKAPIGSACLGDFDLRESGGKLSPPKRRFQGAKVQADFASGGILLAGAVTKGRFASNRFPGEEGKQGPYRLWGKGGEREISLLPGSERVWVDGIPLKRGEERDYTIDYQDATLRFTPLKVIGSESIIVVEFQYTLRDYQRSFFIGQGNWEIYDGKIKLFSSLVSESDDQEDPLSLSLGEKEKEVLSRAGDNPDSAWVQGAKFVGEGKGDYLQETDSLGNPYFLWVGEDSGSYEVSFSWVGQGRGSYIKGERGGYSYVYPGQGNFSPRVYLPLPQSHFLSHFGFQAQPDSGWELQGEVALSREDRNLFSSYDDGDNLGRALILSGRSILSHLPLGGYSLPKAGLRGRYEDYQLNYSPLRGDEERDYRRDWNLDPNPEDRVLRTWELSGHICPTPGLTLLSGAGRLYTKENLSSLRRRYGGILRVLKFLSLNYNLQKARTQGPDSLGQGSSTRQAGKINLSLGRGNLGVGYQKERGERGGESFHTEEKSAFLSFQRWSPLLLSSNLGERIVHSPQYRGETNGVSRTWQVQLTLEEWRSWLGNLSYSRRSSPEMRDHQDLTSLILGYHREEWQGELHYQANSIHCSDLVKTYLKVGEGEGDYRLEGENWVPDEEGDYLMVTEERGDLYPSCQINTDLSLRAMPSPSLRFKTWLRWEEERREERGVLPSLGLKGVYGKIFFQQETDILPCSPRRSLSLRYSLSRRKDERYGGEVENEFEQEGEISLLYHLTKENTLRLSPSLGRKWRRLADLDQYNIRLYKSAMENSLQLSGNWRISLCSIFERDYDSISKKKAELFSLSPVLTRSLPGKGKAEAEFGWDRIVARPKASSLPWAMVEGRKPGDTFRWSFTLSLRISDLLIAELNYRIKSDPLWGRRQRGRMEMRALF